VPGTPKPSLTLVGAGRAGVALGRALASCGYPIGAVVTRTSASAERAVAWIGAGSPASLDDPFPLGEVLLVCVPDDAIPSVAGRIAPRAAQGVPRVALHLSGARGPDALSPLREAGVATGGMHPIRAFSGLGAGEDLEGTWYGLEGEAEALEAAGRLVADLGGRELPVPEGARPFYHAACCFASNAVVAAVAVSVRLMAEAGVGEEDALAALGPLLAGTAEDLERGGPARAMTGPVVRGDSETVVLHMERLGDLRDAGPLQFYRAFSLALLNLAERRGALDRRAAGRLRRALVLHRRRTDPPDLP